MQKIIVTALIIISYISLLAQKTYVFVGSYNIDKTKEGIHVFELDTTNGKLHKVTSVSNVLNPSYLTISKNGKLLFACTDTRTQNEGSVSSFIFNDDTKTLSFINKQKTGGENPVYITINNTENFLLSANYTDGSVSVFPIDNSGKIAATTQFISFKDSSINKDRQTSAHIHAAVFSPDNNFVFLPDLGADKIRCFAFDSLQQQPLATTQHAFTKAVLGSGPRHFTFHPNKKFAYSIEELSGTINVYNYTDGKLDSIQRISSYKKKYKEQLSSADIHISPDGKYLYASNRDVENNIAIFSINKNGILRLIAHQSTFGTIPRNFTIDNTGNFLIVANQKSGNIVVFKRDTTTGLLKKMKNNIVVAGASCVVIKRY